MDAKRMIVVKPLALVAALAVLFLLGCIGGPSEPGTSLPSCGNRSCDLDENAFSCPSDCDAFCPRSCDDFNPCTLDSCDETTGYQCHHDILTGDQPGCNDKTCTGNCYCGANGAVACAPELRIGTCESYACDAGVCRSSTRTNCCGNGACETQFGENFDICPQTKGGDCAYVPYCGNAVCDANEDCRGCARDCGTCLLAGYLDTPGMHATVLTKKQYFAGLDKTVFTSDPDTLFQYTADFSNIAESRYKDKLQNYCRVTTGATCQRIDVFSLLKNTRSVPVVELRLSYVCVDPVSGQTLLDSADGYVENYMRDWNITAYSLPSQTLFTPAKTIEITGQNVQAKGSFYVPSDVDNQTQVNVLLNNAASEGTVLSYLGPKQKAGFNFKLLTMAPPNNNIQFDCNVRLEGAFNDGELIDQSYSFTVSSLHKDLLCGSQQTPGACQEYVQRNGLCSLEYVDNCCGNKTCEAGETYDNCAITLGGDCPYTVSCGNSVCDANSNESIWSCPYDCGSPFRVGVLESNHQTILNTNQGLNAAFRTSQSFLDLNSTSIRLLSSGQDRITDSNYNLCGATGQETCQRIDARTQILNSSTESFTSLQLTFACKDPANASVFFDSNRTINPAAITTRLNDWNLVGSDTKKEFLWIDRNATSTGEKLSGRAQFFVHPTDNANLNTTVVLNTGDSNGTRVLLLKPTYWVDVNMSFLHQAGKTTLYDCNVTWVARSEYDRNYTQSQRFYLRFFHG